MQWLKLFDQSKEHVLLADKLYLKRIIEKKLGTDYFDPKYLGREANSSIPWDNLPDKFVLKTNNDSDSVRKIKNKNQLSITDKDEIQYYLNSSANKIYGDEKGEWYYKHIKPKIFAENFLSDDLADYKLFCTNGKFLWLQKIWDRGPDVKRSVLTNTLDNIPFLFVEEIGGVQATKNSYY